MDQIEDSIRRFRAANPPSGSTEMIALASKIVEEYDRLVDVKLSSKSLERATQIQTLMFLVYLKRDLQLKRFEQLSRSILLYGDRISP